MGRAETSRSAEGQLMKRCAKCGFEKPRGEFHADKNAPDGRNYYCKACRNEHRQANKGSYAAATRRYRQRYPAREAARVAANPHWAWEATYRQRSRRYGFAPVVEQFTRDELIENYGDACWHCGDEWAELDHYPKPVSQGGSHTLDNCRPSCRPCNRRGTRKVAA